MAAAIRSATRIQNVRRIFLSIGRIPCSREEITLLSHQREIQHKGNLIIEFSCYTIRRGLFPVQRRYISMTATSFQTKPSQTSRGTYRRVLSYLAPYRRQFGLALVCLVIFGATDGGVPFLVKHVLDDVFNRGHSSLLVVIPVILVIFALVRGAADFGQQFLMARIGHRVVRDIRSDLNKKLLTLSSDFFLFNSAANLLSRVTSDVLMLRALLTDSLSALLGDSIRIIALVAAAIYLDPTLAAIALLAFPLGIYPVYRFGRRLRKLSRVGQEAVGTLSSRLQESILGHRVVAIFARERYEQERFDRENQRLTDTFIKAEKSRAATGPVNEVLAALAISGVIFYGGYSVISGIRTQGDFIAFLISVFLLYDPFKKLSRVNNAVQQGLASAERVFEILDATPRISEPLQPVSLTASNQIAFEEVSFSYGRDNGETLSAINLVVAEGESVALVGFSGAGKSTLVDLVPRFIDPTRGRITIGGVNIREASLHDLRSRIAMVSQHTFLFNDTIFNNIRYGDLTASDERVYAAAKAAFADTFIDQLPNRYETVVGEGGFSLSGGERQRIAIARAILKNAPILILDEATASLDNRSELEVQTALEHLAKSRTTIVIAHRLSTVRNADRIVVMKEGRIAEIGTHEELLARGGEYEKLHLLQFRESDDGSAQVLN
ncbi:MAG: ATP-binding cassette domain-containing protein [Proteobacteria bacterium]|nr:ATP-binding cassette domain-containing protein [Pseudomonadota bacterium]